MRLMGEEIAGTRNFFCGDGYVMEVTALANMMAGVGMKPARS
jgi:hypothetical protein